MRLVSNIAHRKLRRYAVCASTLLLAALTCSQARTPALAAESVLPDMTRVIVQLNVARRAYSSTEPWLQSHNTGSMLGVSIGERRILTLAAGLVNTSLVRVQKGGRGRWREARIIATDIHTGLGLVTVDDDAFWNDMQSIAIAPKVPTAGEVGLHRWDDGQFKQWHGDVKDVTVALARLSQVQHVKLTVESAGETTMVGQPITRDGELVGLVDNQRRGDVSVISADFIRLVVERVLAKPDVTLGFLDFKLQYLQNPALARHLGLEGEPRGALVIRSSGGTEGNELVRRGDVILAVDGFDIDSRGEYLDPDYGYLSMANLSTRGLVAGDEQTLDLWRNGAITQVVYRLPSVNAPTQAVPRSSGGDRPEYLLAGGVLLQHLDRAYLSAIGRQAPVRLTRLLGERVEAGEQIVIVSRLLQDEYNLGYVQYSNLVVERVNDHRIRSLRDVADALKSPLSGTFHVIEFARNPQRQRMVLDAATMAAATRRVMARYAIPERSHLATP